MLETRAERTDRHGKNDDSNKPTSVAGVDDATKLFLGSSTSCAQVPAGLRCWGDTRAAAPSNVPRPFEVVPGAEVVASSTLFACALRKTGAVACWGGNLVGQLGNGKAPAPATSVKIAVQAAKGGELDIQPAEPLPSGSASSTAVTVTGLTDATAIALGGSHACALRRGGQVVCWGSSSVGQLGDGKGGYGASSDHPVPVDGVAGAVEIAAGKRVTCARTAEAVMCWGSLSEEYPTLADDPPAVVVQRRVAKGLVEPLAQKDKERSRFSRSRPPPQERRVRVTQAAATLDASGRAYMAFAVDVRRGPEWHENDVVGCAYIQTGALFVKYGADYRPAEILLGKDVEVAPNVCKPGKARS